MKLKKITNYLRENYLQLLLHLVFIIGMILILIWVIYRLGQETFVLQQLKNKCIAECFEINKQAGELICVC